MKTITVLWLKCGKRWDSYGASKLLGQTLAKQKIQVVYGGSNVGLMRAVADGALAGGTVIGVLPDFKKRGGTSRFDRINRGKHARAKNEDE
jgi:predicted Rossmann-fold nucleotide-binding protein